MQGLLFVYSRFSPPTTLKKAPEEIGSEVIERIFTIELMLNANVVSYPLSSCPICCFTQGGDSSEACSVATATFSRLWACIDPVTGSPPSARSGSKVLFCGGMVDGWRWFGEQNDELGGIFVPSIWINLEMIIWVFHWYWPPLELGGVPTGIPMAGSCIYSVTCQIFTHDSPRVACGDWYQQYISHRLWDANAGIG